MVRLACVVVAVLAVASGSAQAATYCVHQPATSCGPGEVDKMANLQSALTDAGLSSLPDEVSVGPGQYTGPFSYTGASQVTIRGVGDGTVLRTANANGVTVLTLPIGNTSSAVRDLRIDVPKGNSTMTNFGLRSSGTVEGVNVVIPADAVDDSVGVVLNGGTFRRGSVTGPHLGPSATFAVTGIAGGTPTPSLIEDARVDLFNAIEILGGATIRRVNIVARSGFFLQSESPGGAFVLEDVLWRTPPGAVEGFGVLAGCGNTASMTLTARNLTLVNNATGMPATGVAAVCNVAGRSAAVDLSSSILLGGVRQLQASANSGPATIAVRYSDFDPAKIVTNGAAGAEVTTGAGNVNVAPGFLGADDFRLAAGSPLIDAGDPGGLAGDESATDLAGAPRIVDGLGSGTARRDMGAYEFQPPLVQQPPPPDSGDVVAPEIARLRADPGRFGVARTAAAAKRRRGTRFRFRLSEPASVRLRLRRALPGRRVGARCVKPSRRNRRARRCTRYRRVGTLARSNLQGGPNAIRFSGRVRRRALRPGRYQVIATATDAAGNRSKAARARFIVLAIRRPG